MRPLTVFSIFFILYCGMTLESGNDLWDDTNGPHVQEWQVWKIRYGKEYISEAEEKARFKVWIENKKKIKAHNSRSLATFKLALNELGDMTVAEYRKKYLRSRVRPGTHIQLDNSKKTAIPKEVDWRKAGVVTPVKNQGQLGASWSFSATGSLESQHAIKNGTLVALSERNLVDCCKCSSVEGAFRYVIENHGIDTEAGYPSTKPVGECHFDPQHIGATCTGFHFLPRGNEWNLQVAVANIGPISVYVDASHFSFQLYRSGVYDEPACSTPPVLDHTMVIVGYGVYNGKDFWLVKNSWGKEWGMKGYIMMSRNKRNQCGIASRALYPDTPGFAKITKVHVN